MANKHENIKVDVKFLVFFDRDKNNRVFLKIALGGN